MMDNSTVQNIGSRIQNAGNILITTHIRPDWDAVGSTLGLGLALQATGKNIQMVIEDSISKKYHHLFGIALINQNFTAPFDLSISLDCSDILRIGNVLHNEQPDINIDHHISNQNFGKINLVDPEAAATSVILTECIRSWKLPINKEVASALLTGLLGDTIGFRTTNTSSRELRLAAFLVDQGADLPGLYNKTLVEQSFEAVHFWGAGLQKLQQQGEIIWTSLSLEERTRSGYPGNDDADLINILSSINHLKVAIVFIEQKNDLVKVSWRARKGINVANVAVSFGGGGHAPAAGAEIKGNMEEVQEIVLKKTKELLKFELLEVNKKMMKENVISKTGAFLEKEEGK